MRITINKPAVHATGERLSLRNSTDNASRIKAPIPESDLGAVDQLQEIPLQVDAIGIDRADDPTSMEH
jgi:hypothetical protein